MSALPQTSIMRQAYEAYLRAGMVLVPIRSGKGPITKGWQLKENCWTQPFQIDETAGVGLAHSYCSPPTCALDVDDLVAAREMFAQRGIDLDTLFCAPNAVGITSGNPNHAKLLFRLATPLASKRLMKNGKVIAEFRCATSSGSTCQDVLPSAAIHPGTGQQYQWVGAGHWSAIPAIPESVLNWWQELLVGDQVFRAPVQGEQDVDLAELREALSAISPDCSYQVWMEVGMGLRTGSDDLLAVWDEWSSAGTKYPGPGALAAKWKSFRMDHPNGISIATVFHHARAAGWKRTHDVSTMFSNVAPVAPEDILAGMTCTPPDLDLGLLPPVLGTRAREVAEAIGCDPLVPVWAGLGAVCAAVDARARLTLAPGFEVPPVAWLMVIGSPADKKTPGMKPMLSILTEIEKAAVPGYKTEQLKWQAAEALHAAQMKGFLADAGNIMNQGDFSNLPNVGELPPAPVPLRLTVSDVTSQKLVRHVADRPYGALTVLDEMASWLQKLSSPTSGEDRSTWVVGYEASTYHLDRVGIGSLTADNFAVSILGNVQPKVFRRAAPLLAVDGTLQRFMPAILRGTTAHVGNPMPEWMTSASVWDHAIRTIHGAALMGYNLSPEAATVFREFQHWADAMRQRERFLRAPDAFLTAIGKVEGQAGRLALLFHLLESPTVTTVAGDTMARCIAMIKSYIVPAMRFAYGEVAGLIDASLEYWVTNHVIQIAHQPTCTLSEIRRSARRQVEDMSQLEVDETIRATMVDLERKGWVVLTSDRGRHAEWAINPAIAETFKSYRQKVVTMKQARQDEIRAKVASAGRDPSRVPDARGWRTD